MQTTYSSTEMLAKLVSFKTVSTSSNLKLIFFIKDYLSSYGVVTRLTFNKKKQKANLFAQIGPSVEGGVILSGHSDVVPVEGQSWDTNPFELSQKNDLLYGRGSCDMKGFISVVLAAVPKMTRAKLKKPIQIAITFDEEIGCLGAPIMIRDFCNQFPKAAAVIVGEPTMMSIVNGHKTSIGLKTHVTGFEVHSSLMHTGVSAIMNSATLIEWISRQNEKNSIRAKQKQDEEFDPPYTTLHVGTIRGGTAGNITAKDCRFLIDIRCLPSESGKKWVKKYKNFAKKVETKMKKVNSNSSISITDMHWVEGLKPEKDSYAEALVRQLTSKNDTQMVSYGTEAGQFQAAGYSTIICGPGSIKLAHQPNEYISIEQLNQCENFIIKLIEAMT